MFHPSSDDMKMIKVYQKEDFGNQRSLEIQCCSYESCPYNGTNLKLSPTKGNMSRLLELRKILIQNNKDEVDGYKKREMEKRQNKTFANQLRLSICDVKQGKK